MNEQLTTNSQTVLERISESMYAVFDESKADIIVLAPSLATATSVFDNHSAAVKGDVEYLQRMIVGLYRIIEHNNEQQGVQVDTLLKRAQEQLGALNHFGDKPMVDLINDLNERLEVGPKPLSRVNRRTLHSAGLLVKRLTKSV